MRRLATGTAWVLVIGACVHAAAVFAIPRIIMRAVLTRATGLAAADTPLHMPAITAASRTVPLPSPDLLYSACVLDVSKGPLPVSVTPGAAYLSLAIFDMQSDNIFVTNDQEAAGKPIRLLVVQAGDTAAVPPAGVTVVRLPGARGLLLLRGLAATPALHAISDQARQTLRCGH